MTELGTFIHAEQKAAIIREYNDALHDGNTDLAERIRHANSDFLPADLVFVPEDTRFKPKRKAWQVVTSTTGSLEHDLNKLAEEGYYPFSVIPQKGVYGIAHYVIVAGDLKP